MATTRQPRQFLAVWNDLGNVGSTFEESIFVDGQFWKNVQTVVAPESFGQFGTMFSNQLQIQYDALVAQKATLEIQLATKTELAETLAEQLESSNSQVETLTDEKAELVASLTAANARIAALLQEVPFNPRILKGEAFYNRVSKEDMVTLLTSENPQLVVGGKTIEAYRANKWPVVLDSDDFQQLVGYVLHSGVFDEQEVLAIMTDATREEAYGTE